MSFDWAVIAANWKFLIIQGLLGFGRFSGGTLRLAIPAIILGFFLGVIIGLCRLAHRPWIHYPAVVYVEFFRGVPLVMVIFWFWFLIPQITGQRLPEYTVALTAFVVFEAAYLGRSSGLAFSRSRAANSRRPRRVACLMARRRSTSSSPRRSGT